MYVFSASSQVIGSMYGLSVAGFVFISNSLDKKEQEDSSYEDIIPLIKKETYQITWFMSIFVFIAILFSLMILLGFDNNYKYFITFLNITFILIIHAIAIIITFVIVILDPNKIKKVSKTIVKNISKNKQEYFSEDDAKNISKNKQEYVSEDDAKYISKDKVEPGNYERFLRDFISVENMLKEYFNNNIEKLNKPNIQSFSKYNRKNFSNSKISFLLYDSKIITHKLLEELLTLIKFRNALVHNNNITVDSNMRNLAYQVKTELSSAIEHK